MSTAFFIAEQQEPSTPVDVGTTHRFGEICYGSGNFKDAYEWFKKASEQDQGQATFNNCDSMYNLAICLEQGQGVEKKSNEALKWCKRAAEAGCTQAMETLGSAYSKGLNAVEKDGGMSVMWLEQAVAEGDHPASLVILGQTYLHGHPGVDKDATLGVEYMEKAAEQGHPSAQLELGMMYVQRGK